MNCCVLIGDTGCACFGSRLQRKTGETFLLLRKSPPSHMSFDRSRLPVISRAFLVERISGQIAATFISLRSIMLSRPATKLSLTAADITAYDQRKSARDALKAQQLDSSQISDQSTVEDGAEPREEDLTPAAQTRAARAKITREQRIGVGNSRG